MAPGPTALMSRSVRLAILLTPFLVALAVRLHGLTAESLFMDEIRQVFYYQFDFTSIVRAAATQNQPPLDYWIGHIVSSVSTSDFAARLPAAIFGAGSVLLLTLLGASFTSAQAGALAGLVLALLPFHIYYSQDARPYALPVFLLLALLYVLQYLVRSPSPRLSQYLFVTLLATLFAFSRADFPVVMLVALTGILVLGAALNRRFNIHARPRVLLLLAAALLGGILLYLPLLRFLITEGQRYAPGTDGSVLEWITVGLQRFYLTELWEAWLAQTEPVGGVLTVLVILGGIAAVMSTRLRREPLPVMAVLLLPLVIVGHLFSFYASTTAPLRPPYVIYLLPLSLILAVIPVQLSIERLTAGKSNLLMFAALGLIGLSLSLSVLDYKGTLRRTDWRGLSRYLLETTDTGNIIFADSFVRPGKWEPNLYGFNRYKHGVASIGYSLGELKYRMGEISKSNRAPVLIVFEPRPYFLTSKSTYSLMNSTNIQETPLAEVLSGTSLEVAGFTGLTAIRLKKSTGSLLSDLNTILEVVSGQVPPRPETLDLFSARAVTERLCGFNGYTRTLSIAQDNSEEEQAKRLEKLRTVLEIRNPVESCAWPGTTDR